MGIPSPRDIPEVKKIWHQLPYDKFIVKYTPEIEAYQQIRKFFLEHDYSHLCICPDDLELTVDGVNQLWDDIKKYDYPVLSGYTNVDETNDKDCAMQHHVLDTEKPPASYGSWIREDAFDGRYLQVEHSGFQCQIIRKDVVELTSFRGADRNGLGYLDWQFSKECKKQNIPIMIDTHVKFYHRRFQEKNRIINDKPYSFYFSS